MSKKLPPWYHLWHSWSPWTNSNLRVAGLPDRDLIHYRWCVDCGRVQFRWIP